MMLGKSKSFMCYQVCSELRKKGGYITAVSDSSSNCYTNEERGKTISFVKLKSTFDFLFV